MILKIEQFKPKPCYDWKQIFSIFIMDSSWTGQKCGYKENCLGSLTINYLLDEVFLDKI